MLSLETLRKIDHELANLSDAELIRVRDSLYPIIEQILDSYFDDNDAKIKL